MDNDQTKKDNGYNPRIVAFLCNWCTYTGADLAGVSRLKTSPSVRIIRTMCSGRVDPSFILKAFKLGADGVMIGGCHIGDCHYSEGNYKTLRRVEFLKIMLKEFGIDSSRLRLEWISASEAEKFADITLDFEKQIREIGPLQLQD
ncbi:MAG: hydrogenase iron-sulfur subunit [Bacteroidetes bacterium]|nr:hydrogenase iron-sulfur subunit [Bacteroidota bacterium]